MRLIILCFLLQIPLGIAQSRFNDDSLELLLKTNKTGIIFTWSPFMPLSRNGLEDIMEIAKSNNLPLQILIDPSPFVQLESTDVILDSQRLVKLGILNHFPSLVVYKNGTLLPWMIQGYEAKNSLETLIKNKLEEP